jgi:hypothetical protein
LFRTNGEATHPDLLGKEEREAEDGTGTLEARGDLHSGRGNCEESVVILLFARDMAGRV